MVSCFFTSYLIWVCDKHFRVQEKGGRGLSLCELLETPRDLLLVEKPAGATTWNQLSSRRRRIAPVVSEDISHLCMFRLKDPRSGRALQRPVRYFTNSRRLLKAVFRMCKMKRTHGPARAITDNYRSSAQYPTRAWAQVVLHHVEIDDPKI